MNIYFNAFHLVSRETAEALFVGKIQLSYRMMRLGEGNIKCSTPGVEHFGLVYVLEPVSKPTLPVKFYVIPVHQQAKFGKKIAKISYRISIWLEICINFFPRILPVFGTRGF